MVVLHQKIQHPVFYIIPEVRCFNCFAIRSMKSNDKNTVVLHPLKGCYGKHFTIIIE